MKRKMLGAGMYLQDLRSLIEMFLDNSTAEERFEANNTKVILHHNFKDMDFVVTGIGLHGTSLALIIDEVF